MQTDGLMCKCSTCKQYCINGWHIAALLTPFNGYVI